MKDDIFKNYSKEKDYTEYYKSYVWKTAIGLQKVDNLEPSDYLIRTARKNISGEIGFDAVNELITSYYREHDARLTGTEEADKVSVRIAELLSESSFVFSPVEYISIHRRLFSGIFRHAGRMRDYNITKKEWALDGDTVIYGSALSLKETLEYDFEVEQKFDYKGRSTEEIIAHVAKFISNLWQIHVFGEGNTRTTAVFLIKYLAKLGFKVTNDTFAENSGYFRNALVRANYNNREKGVFATTHYLELFLRNLLLDEDNILSNRELRVDFTEEEEKSEVKSAREKEILNILTDNPNVTLQEVAEIVGKSLRTVKTDVKSLQEKGFVERIGGKKSGSWKVLIRP